MAHQRILPLAWAIGLSACSQSHYAYVPAQNPSASQNAGAYAIDPWLDDGLVDALAFDPFEDDELGEFSGQDTPTKRARTGG
jgi:hypothetical protein